MRQGWKTVRLGEVCVIDKTKHKNGELPYVGMEDIISGTGKFVGSREPKKVGSSTFYFTPEHLLYGRLRPYLNKVLLPDFEGHCSSEIFPLLPEVRLDKSFLFYWITSEKVVKEINRTCTGARMPRANVNELLKLDIPLPTVFEQKRIVTILDEAFAGIDTAITNTEKNLANARELFESYLNLVFTKRGDGWIDQRFGEICSFVRGPFGGSLKKSCFVEEGFAVYEQQHAINDQFESVRYFIDDKKFQEMRRFELFPGDLIMSCSGTMGRVAIVPSTIKRGVINQALLKLTPSDKIDAQYLRLWMESDSFIEEIEKHSQGAAIKNVSSVKVLKEIEVPIPDLSKQKEIVSKILDYREQTNQLGSIYQKKLNSLKELKQSLLQKAFSGELTAKPDKLMDENVA